MIKEPLFRPASPEYDDDEEEGDDEEQLTAEPEDLASPLAAAADESDDELAAALMTKVNISPPALPVASTSRAVLQADLAPMQETSDVLFTVSGSLHLFDRGTGMFMLQDASVEIAVHKLQAGYWLLVQGPAGTWVSQGIDKDMSITFSEVCTVHSAPIYVLGAKANSATRRRISR